MTRPSRLIAIIGGGHSPTTYFAVFPALPIAILFVPSVPVTSFTVTVPLSFPVAVPLAGLALASISIPFRVPFALAMFPVTLSVSMAVSATFAFAFSVRTLTTMLASLRGVCVLPTAVTFGTPVVDTVHIATITMPVPARPALSARVPCARSCRW